MTSYAKNRISPRVSFASPVTVKIGNKNYECNVRDIGTGGILLHFDEAPPELDTKIEVLLKMENASGLAIQGRVARHESDKQGVGVVFVEVSQETQVKLNDYVADTLIKKLGL